MNIAFYGKGGSGKTTVSVLFAAWLDSKGYTIGLLDADVNSQTADVAGAVVDADKVLSRPKNEVAIWKHLAGSNPFVDETEFLNTTPPGKGSGSWTMASDNYITKHYGQAFGNRSHVLTVGSYTADKLGVACHHGTQTVAENMISHAKLMNKEILVIDSVAGNDAFGTTLYLNDVLVFVVKPEREGIAVLNRFLELAKHADVLDRVLVIANQITSDVQRTFLKREIPEECLIGLLEVNDGLIERRLEDKPLGTESIRDQEADVFQKILDCASTQPAYYEALLEIHKKVAGESWVAGSYRTGLQDQIDPDYKPL